MSPLNSSISQSFAVATTFPKIVTDGLVLHLDAGQQNSYNGGTAWRDLSGRGNTGTLRNGPTYSSANGGSIVFDGTNDYVEATNNNGFGLANLSARGTLEIWANVIRRSGSPPYQQLAGFRNDSDFDFYFLLLDSGSGSVNTEARFRTLSGRRDINVDYTNYFGKWTHITFTAATARTDLYINGSLVGSNTNSNGTFGSTSGNFRIGTHPLDSTWQTLGNISKVSFYNRALIASEVSQNFNALRGRYGI